ncbi:type VI secretion system baseplate subunit TssG [Chitinibacteraceae bacterium HSL-7]
MAGTGGRSTRDLSAEFWQDPTQFGFFQAVRMLALTSPAKKRGRLPDKLRFRSVASLSFPPSELALPKKSAADDESRELAVAFMGLIGPTGALPTSYTELVIERQQRHRDHTLHAFVDLFGHRSVSLFYEAWRKYRYWLHVEAGEADGFTRNVLDLSGLGGSSLRDKLAQGLPGMDESLFLYFAGLLSQKPLSSSALTTLIEGFFEVRAQLDQFAGQWLSLPESEQTQLGMLGSELGVSTFAGDRVWDRQTKLALTIGPLRRAQFEKLLPHTDGAAALKGLMQFALGHGLAADVTLELDPRDIPAPVLSSDTPPMLGGTLWLTSQRPTEPAREMRYTLLH